MIVKDPNCGIPRPPSMPKTRSIRDTGIHDFWVIRIKKRRMYSLVIRISCKSEAR